jgi:exonuclease SbcD
MKIIHTSDWHLGQNFFEYDRREDHNNMIDQLADLIKEEEPDALVIAGDVYDIAAPNTSVQRELAEYIVRLHDIRPEMVIVCISGNHDSASRHEIYQTPWEALNVHMTGKIDTDVLVNNIIPVKDKGWIVTVPYTNERFLNDDFFSSLESAVKEHTEEKLPIVYVGHAAISGRDFSGHQTQNEKYIGGIECTSIDKIGEVYDYVALGHIHKAQTFDNGRARYCGSPLPVSFDEVKSGYEHGFSIVEIEAHGSTPSIRTCDVTCMHPLVNIPSEGFALWEDAMKELKKFPADIDAYLRLNILLKGNEMLPYDKDAQIIKALGGKIARLATINPAREIIESADKEEERVSLTMQELQAMDPKAILKAYANAIGRPFDEEFDEMFDIVFKNVMDADHEN